MIRPFRRKRAADAAEPDRPARDEADGPGAGPDANAAETLVASDVPAGTDLDQLVGNRPTTRRRGRLRRRLRHLRGVRELLLRDLGGMVFEVHRSGEASSDAHRRLVADKLARMETVDAEVAELAELLDDHRGLVAREPGIGGTCQSCGELFGSDARFCWACGAPVAPGARRPAEAVGPVDLPALTAAVGQPHIEGQGEELSPPAARSAPPPAARSAPPPAARSAPPPPSDPPPRPADEAPTTVQEPS